jgi:hypothetical protein
LHTAKLAVSAARQQYAIFTLQKRIFDTMMLRFCLFFLCPALFPLQLFAQFIELTPLQVVEHYVSPQGFPAKRQHVAGELAAERRSDTTLGQRLPPRIMRTCRLIREDSLTACVAVWLRDSANSFDYYFYLRKKQVWMMYSIRSLTGTELVRAQLNKLDSVAPANRGKAWTTTHAHTWQFEHANAELYLSNDSALKAYFTSHQTDFKKLLKSLEKGKYLNLGDSILSHSGESRKIRKQLDALLIRSVAADSSSPGGILFVIGGTGDNRCGYFYQPDASKLPPVNERYYILIESLGNGWYLFKTT